MTSFKLEEMDCAIILKEDGSTEIILPKFEDEEADVSDNVILAVGTAALIPTPEFKELLYTTITDTVEKADKEK